MGRPRGSKNKDGEKRRCMSKVGFRHKYVKESEVDQYLAEGWSFGNIDDHQKEDNKKWYNDGVRSYYIKDGDPISDNLQPGMAQKRPGGYAKFNYVWYTNGIEQKRLSVLKGDIIPDGWYKGFSEPYKAHMKEVITAKGNYHLANKNYTDEYKELYHDYDKLKEFVIQNSQLTLEELAKRFNCTVGSIGNLLYKSDLARYFPWFNQETSSLEYLVIEYLHQLGISDEEIILHDRKVLSGKELDIYLPKYNLAIECNGTYYHSVNSSKGVSKNYHFEKSKLAQELGIRLIHLYEWEILTDQIKSLLRIALGKVNNRIFARNCQIKEITNKEAKSFNEINHLQGHRNAQVTYGLFYNDELVQLMSFSRTRYNKNLKTDNSWEIIRGCPGSNNIVVGGVAKLFNYFIKKHNPDSVFSYCDFNKFDGKSYEAIGMSFVGYTGPDKTWVINNQPVKRNPKKYKELKEKADFIVWGSGSKKYEYNKDQIFN